MLKDLIRRFLYASGALPLYHRLRNGRSLTVAMFHRTLNRDDPRWMTCDPDYTLAREVFTQTLEFFRRHYNVVTAEEVLRAHMGQHKLPRRALLLTFDDGWSDNADYALPELRQAGMPGLMFVVADVVGRRQPFWQEQMIAAWRRGTVTVAELATRLASVAGTGATDVTSANEDAVLRKMIAQLETLSESDRAQVLAALETQMDDGMRHMVDRDDLVRLCQGGVALGLHGKTHMHMTRASNLDSELAGARATLAAALQGTAAEDATLDMISFPHGAFNSSIAERARDSGYRLLFTSVPVLNQTRSGPGWLLGRIGFETDTVVDHKQRFRPDWLAWYFFRRPVLALKSADYA